MNSYQATVASFVPAIIRDRALASADVLEEPGVDGVPAGVLFADISGFTSLTEQLSQRGPEGAEELTGLLNRYFGTIIDTIDQAGGDVLKFAGDALLAVWATGETLATVDEAVERITEVSRVLQATLHDFEVAPGIRLSMKLAIGAGVVEVEHLGGVFDRWEFLVSGTPLAQLGRANDCAQPGDIVLSDEAAALLDERYRLVEAAPGVKRLDDAQHPPTPVDAPLAGAELSSEQTERLLTFLPAAIRQRVAAGYADWLCELRQVSIVFMNLPGFGVDTPIEQAQEAMRTLQTSLYRFEGSINKMSVDDKGVSLIAVLGLPPLSHTDDPERAIRAAMDMRAGLAELNLASSVGVCTGVAFCGVVGNDRRREYTVMGDVVNLSARLMQAARGGVLCDAPSRRSAGERLQFETLEPIRVKGKARPIEVFVPLRTDARAESEDEPRLLQGRERERKRLRALLDAVMAGGTERLPRICISADGGLGKWSLVAEMMSEAQARRAEVLVVTGDPLDTLTPFRSWRDTLGSMLGVARGRSAAKLDAASLMERLPNQHARQYAPLLRDVLTVPLEDNEHTRDLQGEGRREHTLELLADLVGGHAELGPTVVTVRDAHLLDASSWALLERVATTAPHVLVAVTMRPGVGQLPEAARSWLNQPSTEHLELGALDDGSLVALACQRLEVERLDDTLTALLIERCAGNPLYCEELLAVLRESGDLRIDGNRASLEPGASSDTQRFPASLQGLISSRIDGLNAEAQMTLKVASVVGQMFAVELVAHTHPRAPKPRELSADIRTLVDLDLIARVPFGSSAEFGRAPYYQFKKELVRDVAYGLMLYSQRRTLHRRMAEWIEQHKADELAPHYATLGHHWALAAEGRHPDLEALERAADYLEKGADRAAASYANPEAVLLYREALARVAQRPEGEARTRTELGLLLKLGGPLIASRSYADPDVQAVYDRARQLGTQVGEHAALFGAVRGLWQGAIGRSDYQEATQLADELVTLAGQLDDAGLALEAHRAVGNSAFWQGQLEKARQSMEYAVEVAAVHPDAPLPEGFSQDPDIANRGILAWALASLGYPRSAVEQVEAAVDRGSALSHPFSMAYALGAAMWTYFILREPAAAEDHAEQLIEISEAHGFPYFAVAGRVARAWAAAAQGDVEPALTDLRETLDGWRNASGGIGMALFLYAQAETQALAGHHAQALKTLLHPLLTDRLEVEKWYLADVIRLRGECEWATGERPQALATLRESRRVATEHNARLAALRLACFEAAERGRDEHWAALTAAIESLPERIEGGTVARAVALAGERA